VSAVELRDTIFYEGVSTTVEISIIMSHEKCFVNDREGREGHNSSESVFPGG
jgi:hypothetical protein